MSTAYKRQRSRLLDAFPKWIDREAVKREMGWDDPPAPYWRRGGHDYGWPDAPGIVVAEWWEPGTAS